MLFGVVIFSLFFSWISYKNFKTAIALFIVFLPSYFIRFNIGPLPSSLLEVMFFVLFLVWLFRYHKNDFKEIKNFFPNKKLFLAAILAFLFFSTFGILISGETVKALGIWRAYFLEPIIFFLVLIGRRKEINRSDLIEYLGLSVVSIALLAIVQKITGSFFSPTLRSQDIIALNGRVTSFFTSPNAIGLYVAPIIPLLFLNLKNKKYEAVVLVLALAAVVLSVSEGAFVALTVAGLVSILFLGYRKIFAFLCFLSVVAILVFAPLRSNLMFKNHSGSNRLVLWGYTVNFLEKSPSNFIFGAGLRQWFEKVQKPVNDFKKIEPLIYPHNLFLNFWSEVGLLAMLSFVLIYFYSFKEVLKKYKKEKKLAVILLASLLVFFVHGMVDVPYFKNDLSFLWWIITAIVLI